MAWNFSCRNAKSFLDSIKHARDMFRSRNWIPMDTRHFFWHFRLDHTDAAPQMNDAAKVWQIKGAPMNHLMSTWNKKFPPDLHNPHLI